jgi:hypothetical protein
VPAVERNHQARLAPAYEVIHIDALRRIWLQRYQFETDTVPHTWDVIARDGAWLGSVQTPRSFTLYRIGEGCLLGRRIDSLGVERVQVLRTHAR